MNEIVAAYIAGIIDGEGCIRIGKFPTKNKTPSGFQFRVVVEVTMCEKETIEFLSVNCHRNLQTRKLKSGKIAYKVVWYNGFAFDLLQRIVPYLHGKKLQAEEAMKCHALMPGRGRVMSDEVIAQIESYRTNISWLKSSEALRC